MATKKPAHDRLCHILALPREIRDQIYAGILLDFPTPSLCVIRDCAMLREMGPLSCRSTIRFPLDRLKRTHKIETNILLTNRQILSEGKQIILRRGRLVKVIDEVGLSLRLTSCMICLIDAKYSSLCMMSHHLHYNQEANGPPPQSSVLVLCGRDVATFCRAIMGYTTFELHDTLSTTTRQTLAFTTNFHEGNVIPEFLTRHNVHRQALKPFRRWIGASVDITLQGSCIGLSRVLARTALHDFTNNLLPHPDELLEEIREAHLLQMQLLAVGTTDVFELVAPFDKAFQLCVASTMAWTAIKRIASDPRDFTKKFVSEAYRILVRRHMTYTKYESWRDHTVLDDVEVLHTRVACALETYEMCLTIGEYVDLPGWTPETVCETEMCMNIAGALAMPLDVYGEEVLHEAGLALGYKAATRATELAPGEKEIQRCMGWYESRKKEADGLYMFRDIDDEVLKERGMQQWAGLDPGPLMY